MYVCVCVCLCVWFCSMVVDNGHRMLFAQNGTRYCTTLSYNHFPFPSLLYIYYICTYSHDIVSDTAVIATERRDLICSIVNSCDTGWLPCLLLSIVIVATTSYVLKGCHDGEAVEADLYKAAEQVTHLIGCTLNQINSSETQINETQF